MVTKELKTIKDYTEALKKFGKEVKPGTKLAQLKAAHTRAYNEYVKSQEAPKEEKKPVAKKAAKKAPKEADVVPTFKKARFQNVYTIIRVLGSGHTKTHYHCKAKDEQGNILTLHVPHNLFNN